MKSNRKQHRIGNAITASLLLGGGIILGDAYPLAAPIACLLMENYATPDRDIERQRGNWLMHWYWLIYAGFIPKHRHPLSHSLLFGLPFRVAWSLLPLAAAWAFYAEPQWADVANAAAPAWPIVWRALLGCIISDVCHYALDDFGVVEMMVGKRKPR